MMRSAVRRSSVDLYDRCASRWTLSRRDEAFWHEALTKVTTRGIAENSITLVDEDNEAVLLQTTVQQWGIPLICQSRRYIRGAAQPAPRI